MAGSQEELFFEDEERQLIEKKKKKNISHIDSSELNMKRMAKQKIRKAQRKYLVGFSMTIPLVKFALACVSLSLFISEDTLGHEVLQANAGLQKVDVLFFYILFIIPISAITLVFGAMIYSNFPQVGSKTVNGYLIFRGVVLLLETAAWIVSMTQFYIPIHANIAAEIFVMSEAFSILLLKSYSKEYAVDPSEQPSTTSTTVEMENLNKTDPAVEHKPVSFIAPGGQVVSF